MHDLTARSGPSDGTPSRAARVVVHGRVQGVSFRWSLQRAAQRHHLVGWVRNREDGGVEAWLEGSTADVAAVEAWIHAGGPPSAEVSDVEADAVDPAGLAGFTIEG